MDCEQIGEITVAHALIENTHRLGIPAQPQVALIGGNNDIALPSPGDHFSQMRHSEHFSIGIARGVQEEQRRGGGGVGLNESARTNSAPARRTPTS